MGDGEVLAAAILVAVIVAAAAHAVRRGRGRARSHFRPRAAPVCREDGGDDRNYIVATEGLWGGCGPLARGPPTPPLPGEFGAGDERHYAADATGRGAAGTVAWDPFSTQARVSLERGAESPEVATMFDPAAGSNPITGVGNTASVRAMGDRHRRCEALTRLTIFELQPGQPGFMEPVPPEEAPMSLAANARDPPPGALCAIARGAACAPARRGPCALSAADVDSDFGTDGFYGDAVLRESFTSRRTRDRLSSAAAPNDLIAHRTGLGSIRLDPRFDPGPQGRVPGGDAHWAHGGHAGGPTFGNGLASSRFPATNSWDWRYVHGFGDGGVRGARCRPEAVVTGHLH